MSKPSTPAKNLNIIKRSQSAGKENSFKVNRKILVLLKSLYT